MDEREKECFNAEKIKSPVAKVIVIEIFETEIHIFLQIQYISVIARSQMHPQQYGESSLPTYGYGST